MKDGKEARRREPYRRRRSARGATARAATQIRLCGPGLRLIATLLAAAGHSDPGASSRKAQDYGDRSPACLHGGGLSGAVTADLGTVIGAEAQKTERRDERDQCHEQEDDAEIASR